MDNKIEKNKLNVKTGKTYIQGKHGGNMQAVRALKHGPCNVGLQSRIKLCFKKVSLVPSFLEASARTASTPPVGYALYISGVDRYIL